MSLTETPENSYCAELVRTHDPDRYRLALLAPPDKRAGLFALYAFNYEIARTREVVTETMMGQIRLQWWRDALKGLYEGQGAANENHEIFRPLADTIGRYDLPREAFDCLLYAREFDLENTAPANLDGLKLYAASTTAPLNRLAVHILTGPVQDMAAVKSAATGYAMTGLLRAVPFFAGQQRQYLPEDLMKESGADTAGLFAGRVDENLKAVIRRVAEAAGEELGQARENGAGLDPVLLPVLLSVPLAEMNLRVLEKAGFNPFDRRVADGPVFAYPRLFFRGIRGRW